MKYLLIILLSTIILSSCENENNSTSEPEAHNHSHSDTPSNANATSDDKNKAYQLGSDYQQLANIYDTENTEQVVVYEFFSYACGHC